MQRGEAEPEPIQNARAEVLDEDIRAIEESKEDVLVDRVLQIEDYRLLIAVRREEVGRLPPRGRGTGRLDGIRIAFRHDERGTPTTGVVARARGFDLDDPGTEITQHHRRVGAGQGPGQVDDNEPGEGTGSGGGGGRHGNSSRWGADRRLRATAAV